MTRDLAIVYLVDDDAAVRDALRMALSSAGFQVKSYHNGELFLHEIQPGHPGCIVLDLRMPGMSGLEVQAALIERGISTPVIFLSAHGDIPSSVQAVKAGAVDFLSKPCRSSELIERINEALVIDANLREEHAELSEIQTRYQRLTQREREVMAQVVTGRSSKEIARELGVSFRTVEIHRSNIMEKMQAGSLAELVAQAVTCGIHSLPN